MKRTRRIEITRYRSRVTLSGDDAEPEGAETATIDLLLEVLGATPQVSNEVFEERRAEGDATSGGASPLPRRCGLLRLPGWLRRG
jgi:hypothetical protein